MKEKSNIQAGAASVVNTIRNTKDHLIMNGKVKRDSLRKKAAQRREAKKEEKRLKELSPMANSAPGNITGPLFLIFGLVFLGVCLGLGAVMVFIYHRDMTFVAIIGVVPLILSLLLLYLGIKQNIHAETYAAFRSVFREQPFASISELAEAAHQSDKRAANNLRSFVNEGLFPKGFFTDDDKYFVLSEGAKELLDEHLAVETKAKVKKSEVKRLENEYPELFEIYNQITEARETLNDLKKKKKALSNPHLEDELLEMDRSLKQIQTYILKKPEEVPDLSNFLDYFLPMITKLLDTYCELNKVKIRTDNVIKSQNEIEDGLKTVNQALKNIYNDFYMGTAMDVYSDVKVLKQMIISQGFGDSDFEEN